MKKIFTLLIGMILFVTANAQAPQLNWAKSFNGKSASTDSTSVMKMYILDKSVYIAGTSDAYGKGNDIVLIKRDYATGDTLWTRHYNGSANGDDQAVDMEINQTTGDVYVTGKSMGISTGYDVVTLKYSATGVLGWANRWDNKDNNGDDIPKNIGIDGKDRIIISATTYNKYVAINGGPLKEDVLILGYDTSGLLIVKSTYEINVVPNWFDNNGSTYYNYWYSADLVGKANVSQNGAVFIAGQCMKGALSDGFSQAFLTGINIDQITIYGYHESASEGIYSTGWGPWPSIKRLLFASSNLTNPDDHNFFNTMDLDNSNNTYIANLMDTISGIGTYYRIEISKVDTYGQIIWKKKTGGNVNYKNLRANAIKADSNGNVYAAGYEKNNNGNFDWFVIKYNSSGVFQWRKTKNGTGNGNDIPCDIAFDQFQNPVVVGVTKNTITNNDITFLKYNKTNGAELFSVNYDSYNGDDKAYNIIVDASQKIIINGIQNTATQSQNMVTLLYCNPPATAEAITGSTTICQGQNSVVYIVPIIENATSYIWTLPGGATGESTTNNITVNYSTSAVSGNITVKGHNDCADGAISTLAITVNPLPANAGTISGTTTVCQGSNTVTYTVPSIANATSYFWSLPTGVTGTSTTNSISVIYGSTSASGNITVKGHNSCGDGATSTLAITVNSMPANAGTITGNSTVCQGQNLVTYTVPVIPNATSYVWTLPDDVTGASTTNTIKVDYGMAAVSGGIEVYGKNACGDGNASIIAVTVNPAPSGAGTITGTSTVCQGQNSITYSVPTIANATWYIWTLPAGATGTSTTKSITVNYGTSAVSGDITVKGHFSCGDGASSTLSITVNPLPANAGLISGTTTVCQGQNSVLYAVPTIANATSYIWTLPNGATGTSSTKTIAANYGTSAVSGNITVKGSNSCGVGAISTLPVVVNATPITPTATQITLNNINALRSNASTGNQWYNKDGIIVDATTKDYTPKISGDYYVIVTANGCPSNVSNTVNYFATGIDPIEFAKAIKVYPNPVTNELTIELEGNTTKTNFEVLNSAGQVVFSGNLIEKTIVPTTSFTPGVYLIKLETGKSFEFKKIIKK